MGIQCDIVAKCKRLSYSTTGVKIGEKNTIGILGILDLPDSPPIECDDDDSSTISENELSEQILSDIIMDCGEEDIEDVEMYAEEEGVLEGFVALKELILSAYKEEE